MTLTEIGAQPLSGRPVTTVIPAGEPVHLEADAAWAELGQVLLRWRGLSWLIRSRDAEAGIVSLITVRLLETGNRANMSQ